MSNAYAEAIETLEKARAASADRVAELQRIIASHQAVVDSCTAALAKLVVPDLRVPIMPEFSAKACECLQRLATRADAFPPHECTFHLAFNGQCMICGHISVRLSA